MHHLADAGQATAVSGGWSDLWRTPASAVDASGCTMSDIAQQPPQRHYHHSSCAFVLTDHAHLAACSNWFTMTSTE